MLKKILFVVNDIAAKDISLNANVTENQRKKVAKAVSDAFINGLRQDMTVANTPHILDLFSGNGPIEHNPVASNITHTVTYELASHTELSHTTSGLVASSVVPKIIAALAKKVNESQEVDFNIETLIRSIVPEQGASKRDILSELYDIFGRYQI